MDPFRVSTASAGVRLTAPPAGLRAGTKCTRPTPRAGKRGARTMSHPTPERPSDGRHLFQIAEDRIQKIDPDTGRVLSTIPAPGGGGDSGLAWAEGTLWVGQHRERKIHQIDPQTGVILRTIESNRFVTGVTWVDGELWHGTWEGDDADVRRIDPETGEVLERLDMPPGMGVSGLAPQSSDPFFSRSRPTPHVRALPRPRRRP